MELYTRDPLRNPVHGDLLCPSNPLSTTFSGDLINEFNFTLDGITFFTVFHNSTLVGFLFYLLLSCGVFGYGGNFVLASLTLNRKAIVL
ncbi:hypothetical protein VNO80_16869 [Phaseolus coccineus]|uniref:Uncharacterized protein n=1 Tax=Phaseolus coccineus TaxID=3886 RepID=A0AAN9R3M8_PHACN